jgi:hypothetical protein
MKDIVGECKQKRTEVSETGNKNEGNCRKLETKMKEIVGNWKQKCRTLSESANKNEWKCRKSETKMEEIGKRRG